MSDESKKHTEVFRLEVAIEDAQTFEKLLEENDIKYKSYSETVQHLIKVFVFYKSDSSKIDKIVNSHQIKTAFPDNPMITQKTINGNKIALFITLIIAILFIIQIFI